MLSNTQAYVSKGSQRKKHTDIVLFLVTTILLLWKPEQKTPTIFTPPTFRSILPGILSVQRKIYCSIRLGKHRAAVSNYFCTQTLIYPD